MDASRPVLRLVSPLPPARNGIADYAALLAAGLSAFYAVEHGDAGPPPPRLLYQLGNNIDHGFVLRALRRWPGVVTLHDPGLLWLRQQMGEAFLPGLMAPADSAQARLAARRGRQLRDGDNGQGEELGRADHLLFDQAGEVLAASRAVVVHSRFAAARLRVLHGEAATRHVTVIPHMVPSVPALTRAAARAALGLPEAGFILGSAGFVHPGKRFDWLLAAMAQARAGGAEFYYIHAGADDPALPLGERLSTAGRVTGWLSAAALDLHIASCDALVCLHFPSHGESSGVLARGLALGVGCLVADTAACVELPRDAVLHLPVPNAVPALAAAIAALVANPALAWTLGAAGRRYAEREMAMPVVVSRYYEAIEDSLARIPATLASENAVADLRARCGAVLVLPAAASAAQIALALAPLHGKCRLLLAAPDLAALAALTLAAPALLHALLPPWASVNAVRVLEPPGQPGLLLDLLLP